MNLQNKIMLITYADSMGKNLKELHEVLNKHYREAVGGVHILPFFPSSADRGFAPMRYDKVDEAFGTVKEYIQECNADANSNTVKQINILRKEVEALKEQNKKRVAEWFQELQYFKSVAEVLGKAKITKTA